MGTEHQRVMTSILKDVNIDMSSRLGLGVFLSQIHNI